MQEQGYKLPFTFLQQLSVAHCSFPNLAGIKKQIFTRGNFIYNKAFITNERDSHYVERGLYNMAIFGRIISTFLCHEACLEWERQQICFRDDNDSSQANYLLYSSILRLPLRYLYFFRRCKTSPKCKQNLQIARIDDPPRLKF